MYIRISSHTTQMKHPNTSWNGYIIENCISMDPIGIFPVLDKQTNFSSLIIASKLYFNLKKY